MMCLFQREFNAHAMVFTRSKQIIAQASECGITIVKKYPSDCAEPVRCRTNRFGMPYVRGMFAKAKQMFDSDYYGYINSDILLTFNLFDVLEICKKNAELGIMSLRVVSTFPRLGIARNRGESARSGEVQPASQRKPDRLSQISSFCGASHASVASRAFRCRR